MNTKGQDIGCAYRIARAGGPAMGAPIHPAVSAPPPAYGTRLRAVGLINDDGADRLVIKLLDNLAGARLADRLCLRASGALHSVVERLAHIAQRARKCLGHLVCHLVAEIAHLALRFVQQTILAPLQTLPPARMLLVLGLLRAQMGQLLIAVLDRGFRLASTDEDDLLPIGGRNQGIHP